MVYRWSVTFIRKSLEDVFRLLKGVIRAYAGGYLGDVLKKAVMTSISDQSRTSLRPNLRRFYEDFATPLCWLGFLMLSGS